MPLSFTPSICHTAQPVPGLTAHMAGAEVREQQMAAVLAVKAHVQSAPYDIPPWLGPLLVGLLRAAKAPQPLRSIVRYVASNTWPRRAPDHFHSIPALLASDELLSGCHASLSRRHVVEMPDCCRLCSV